MANFKPFSDLLQQSQQAGFADTKTQESRNWLRAKAQSVSRVREASLMRQQDRFATRPVIGQMYLFSYDPKTKDELPYYDRLPLIFPFAAAGGSMYGINMHYLPYVYRAKLMDALYTLVTGTDKPEQTRLRMSYDILNRASRFRYFKPCVKQYLNSHIQSRLIRIAPEEWDAALFLPLERFQKARKQRVFKESMQKV